MNEQPPISEDAAYCIYQLMLGGIDETQPLRLATLAGVDARLLNREFLAKTFVWSHRRFGGLRWSKPAEPVKVVDRYRDRKPRSLPDRRAESLLCLRCNTFATSVPCSCEGSKAKGPRWETRHRKGRRYENPRNITQHGDWVPVTTLQALHEEQYGGQTISLAGRH